MKVDTLKIIFCIFVVIGIVGSNYPMKAEALPVALTPNFVTHIQKSNAMKTENWKGIPGYEGKYQASNLGRIKSESRFRRSGKGFYKQKEKILSQTVSTSGYYSIMLSVNSKQKRMYAHQLIAMAFLNHIPNGFTFVIDHIDKNRLNNNVDNLRIVTMRENTNQSHLKSTSKFVGVRLKGKKYEAAIRVNGKIKYLGRFIDELDASIAYQTELKKITV